MLTTIDEAMGECDNCGGRGIKGMPCTTCEDSGMIYDGSDPLIDTDDIKVDTDVDSDVDTDVDSNVDTDVDSDVDSNDGDATTSDEAMGECDSCGGRGIEGMPCTTCEDSGMIYG